MLYFYIRPFSGVCIVPRMQKNPCFEQDLALDFRAKVAVIKWPWAGYSTFFWVIALQNLDKSHMDSTRMPGTQCNQT